jgi:membrane-bound ClpP family serine protease
MAKLLTTDAKSSERKCAMNTRTVTSMLATSMLVALFVPAHGATITSHDGGTAGNKVLSIEGKIEHGEFDSFMQAIKDCCNTSGKNVVIELNSGGGVTGEGWRISRFVHNMGYQTLAKGDCESACAMIWIAGSTRWMIDGVEIGFHASYDTETKKPIKVDNDILRKYYTTELHLPKRTADWMLVKPTMILTM